MNCAVYKSEKKSDYYVYLKRVDEEAVDFSCIPEALDKLLGNLEFVMDLELSEARKLAQADVTEVIASLREEGFYLQTPPKHEIINFIENSKL
ncbi:Protein YcgL [hydrothermal vent metagenome]|uniref:Protein YcgL n=1 Tax=hydrothermal vent metagenome TaxID=652676 RepID=A0A3B0ZAL6_9ZZZZ